jgi:chromosome segregation ATPase
MTDTINHNGAHDVHNLDAPTIDTDDDSAELEAAAQDAERRLAKWETRKREVNKEMDQLRDRLAVISAEIGRCNRQIAIARGGVKVRRKKATVPARTNGRK